MRTRNRPEDAPDKWQQFIDYNKRDVETEAEIERRLNLIYSMPGNEIRRYWIDQQINDDGIAIDMDTVNDILAYGDAHAQKVLDQAQEIAGISIKSVKQLKEWLEARTGLEIEKVTKETVADLIKTTSLPDVKKVLELRLEAGKTSVKKYDVFKRSVTSDGRIHGCFQFYGSRTGRFAGRLVQPQNLPRNSFDDFDWARQLVKWQDWEELEATYPSMNDVFATLIRTVFIPRKGCAFAVADYSAIEARVIAWLADEKWRLDAFREGRDIYCESASQMFHVPVEKHGINGHLRKQGKVAELACIAKGQRVLTDKGLIPIELVTKDMKLWDGKEWVSHAGVVYKGKKRVIEHAGLRATPDHLVYIEGQHNPVHFGKSAKIGAHYTMSGDGRRAIRVCEDHQSGEAVDEERQAQLVQSVRPGPMSNVWGYQMDSQGQLDEGQNQRMPALQPAFASSEMAKQTVHGGQAKMYQSEGQELQKLRGQRNRIPVQDGRRGLRVHDQNLWDSEPGNGAGPNRCKRTLRAREFTMGDTPAELSEPEEVYDILNAGPRHRYTVEGHLVHNCGYGGGVNALKAFGAEKMGMTEEEMAEVVVKWRSASPNVCRLWQIFDRMVAKALAGERPQGPKGMEMWLHAGCLMVKLPSGRCLVYQNPRMEAEKGHRTPTFTFDGVNQTTRKWAAIHAWGGKLTENVVQAIARDCLVLTMDRLHQYWSQARIVMHIHDEVVVEVPAQTQDEWLQRILDIMAKPILWAPGLELKGAGFTADYYQKD